MYLTRVNHSLALRKRQTSNVLSLSSFLCIIITKHKLLLVGNCGPQLVFRFYLVRSTHLRRWGFCKQLIVRERDRYLFI